MTTSFDDKNDDENDDLDDIGAMDWLAGSGAADDPSQVQLTLHLGTADKFPWEKSPIDCTHEWVVDETIYGGDLEGQVLLAVWCGHCQNRGFVLDPTNYELRQIEHIQAKGEKAIWRFPSEVIMVSDYLANVRAMAQSPVANLVNGLELFEDEDGNIPF